MQDEELAIEKYEALLINLSRASSRLLKDTSKENQINYDVALDHVLKFERETFAQLGDLEHEKTLYEVLVSARSDTLFSEQTSVPRDRLQVLHKLLAVFRHLSLPQETDRQRSPQLAIMVGSAAVIVIGVLIITFLLSRPEQISPPNNATIVALKVEGTVEYTRPGWIDRQSVLNGSLLNASDAIYPDGGTLLVMCPDASIHQFASPELAVNNLIPCSYPANVVIENEDIQSLQIQKGGRQDPTVPYLISPRATLVRVPFVELIWNHAPGVERYSIIVRGNADVIWQNESLTSEAVAEGEIGKTELPVSLEENTAYTVEICAQFSDARQVCTTDPGYSAGVNVAFYYQPSLTVEQQDSQLITRLGEESPESLYARAILLSQPVVENSPTERPTGYYQEAIMLLEQLINEASNSPLAASPELYNRLGELYRRVNLPLSAARAFVTASELATPGTEAAAQAALGSAITTPDSNATVKFYDEALDDYASFLSDAAFEAQFQTVCKLIGDICLDLSRCQSQVDICEAWFRDS